MKKYSKNFERDWNFYIKNRNVFTFCGTLDDNAGFKIRYDRKGKNGKQIFYEIESYGRNNFETEKSESGKPQAIVYTKHPLLVSRIFLVKSSINFMIKQWAEIRVEGTLPLTEFSKKKCIEYKKHNNPSEEELKLFEESLVNLYTIEWHNIKGHPMICLHSDMQEQYGLPDWVIDAVEKQKLKILLPNDTKNN